MSANWPPTFFCVLDQSRFTPNISNVDDATKIELYVPTMTPQIIAKTNPRITSPPSTNSEINASNVVKDVMNVRLKVSLIDRFRTSFKSFALYLRRFSRTRSNTTTVSFKEYPTIVKSAAMIARSNWIFSTEKIPIVSNTSCTNAATAPNANCHSNRIQI